jgi:hypothetical protein
VVDRYAPVDSDPNGYEPSDRDPAALVPHKRGRQRAASGERRRKARCGGVGEFAAGVFQFPRGKRQGDDRLAANPTADSRGGDDDAQRRTASGGGGARPANPIGCY